MSYKKFLLRKPRWSKNISKKINPPVGLRMFHKIKR